MALAELFHPLGGIAEREKLAANTRALVGDGSEALRAPGLKRLESVRIGALPVPMCESRRIPTNLQLTEFETVECPLFDVTRADDGTPVVRRSRLSNDGYWQAGVPVYVTGEWESRKG